MSATIADAVLAELATLYAAPSTPLLASDVQVWDGEVRGIPANRYYLAGIGNELRTSSTVDNVARDYSSTFTITSVAMNPDAQVPVTMLARNMAKKARDRLVGLTLTVDGLTVGCIQHTFTQRPQKDDDITDRTVMFVVDEYAVLATA